MTCVTHLPNKYIGWPKGGHDVPGFPGWLESSPASIPVPEGIHDITVDCRDPTD